jgi:two-component system, OmpR family, heavy metal sensor histidine kinase CusS
MRMSIRWKLTLWYGGVLATVLAAFSVAVFLILRQQSLARIDQGLAEELSDVLFEINRAGDAKGLHEWLERRFYRHEGFDFQVTKPTGERFFVNARLASTSLPLPSSTTDAPSYRSVPIDGQGRWRIVSVQGDGPDGQLTVQVARSLAAFDREMAALLLTFLWTVPLTVLIAISGGYVLARRALRPVHKMTQAANQITADRLNQRIDVDNPDDELGALGQTLNRMIERLQRSFAEIRLFTADASHELRTPLTAIRTEVEVGLRNALTQDECRHLLGSVLEECGRLTHMTDQLLTLAREDFAAVKPPKHPVDLARLVEKVVENLRPLAEAKGLALTIHGDGSLTVFAEEARLTQVFINLVDNAIKYTPAPGSIVVTFGREGSLAVVRVSDTGIGISPEHLPSVFQRFYRVDKARSRDQGGTGLGLSIAQSIVEAHGGRIELDSVAGQGTNCAVKLPLHEGSK